MMDYFSPGYPKKSKILLQGERWGEQNLNRIKGKNTQVCQQQSPCSCTPFTSFVQTLFIYVVKTLKVCTKRLTVVLSKSLEPPDFLIFDFQAVFLHSC